jgi:hypothetical protein
MVTSTLVPQNGQRIAVWSVVGAIVTGLIGYFSLVNIAQKPLEERIASIGARVDTMATDTAVWRGSFSAEVDRRMAQIDARSEERRAQMYDRLSTTDAERGATMIEFRQRLDAIEQDRARIIGQGSQQIQRLEEWNASLDKRVAELVAAYNRIQDARSEILQRSAASFQEVRDRLDSISERMKQIEIEIGRDAIQGRNGDRARPQDGSSARNNAGDAR